MHCLLPCFVCNVDEAAQLVLGCASRFWAMTSAEPSTMSMDLRLLDSC